MAKSRPFAYNPGSQIPGTQKFGNLTVGSHDLTPDQSGVQWWNGPDEDLGYVIAQTNVDGFGNPLQPTQIPNVYGSVGFFRTAGKNTTAFINLTNAVSGQNFTTATQCKTWLESNNRWTSWSDFATEAIVAFKTRVLSSGGNFEAETNLENQLNTLGSTLFDSASLIITPNAYKEGVLFAVKPDKVGTNLLLQSEGFTSSPWGLLAEPLITRTANAGTSPIGTNNATLLTSNTDLHSRGIRQVVTLSKGVQYVFSVWARSDNGARIQLDISDNGNTFFNLTTEWQRIQITGQYWVPYGDTMQFVDITFAANQLGKTCLIWGAQLEIGTTAGTYIPTTTRQGINETIGDLAVTRATTATRVNEQGLIEPVPYNLFLYSEDFGNSFWTKSNSTVTTNTNQTMSPIGTNTVDLYVPNTALAEHPIISFFSSSNSSLYINSANTYNWSIYVKSAGNNFFLLRVNINGTWSSVVFNLSSSSIVSTHPNFISANIENVGNGWRLLSCVFTGVNDQNVFQHISSPTGNTYFSGDGTSGAYIWGAQLTLGTSKRDYFATTDRLNVARIDYTTGSPAILVEPQRTNLLSRSEEFENSYWQKGGGVIITPNVIESPSGTLSADKFEISNNVPVMFTQFTNLTSPITLSFYIKKGNSPTSANRIGIRNGTTGKMATASINTDTGEITIIGNDIGGTFSSIKMANGWFRFICTVNSNIVNGDGIYVYVGGLGSIAPNDIVGNYSYIWGAQLEVRSNATSYIPTTTSSVTRNADISTLSGLFTKNIVTSTGGSWYVELINERPLIRTNASYTFYIGDSTYGYVGNAINIRNNAGFAENLTIDKIINGVRTGIADLVNGNPKILINWNGSTANVFINGVKKISNTTFPATNLQFLSLGGLDVSKNIKNIMIFPYPLTDQQAIQLTTL